MSGLISMIRHPGNVPSFTMFCPKPARFLCELFRIKSIGWPEGQLEDEMRLFRFAWALGLAATLTACGATDIVSRDAPFAISAQSIGTQVLNGSDNFARTSTEARLGAHQQSLADGIGGQIHVAQVNVTVPERLRVSEANRYYPTADIVWREDPIGDRHAQVATIVQDALTVGTQAFQGPRAVILDVEVTRFHALTEKARYTVGGVHNIIFNLVLRDAQTGLPMSEPHLVEVDLDAFGGQQAIDAEALGLTQKVRISNHLAEVIRQELTRPEGYRNARLGFFQMINKI